MALEITANECEQVRLAIDIKLDIVTLPNSVILQDIYAGHAVRRVRDQLPAGYDGSHDVRLLTACIYSCAALIVPAMKHMQTETIAGHVKTFKILDWEKKILDLESRVDQIVDEVLILINDPVIATSDRPTFFTLAKAKRADRRW